MADLVSDTTISARDYSEEEDFYSDDPNDFMPLITSHPEEKEEEEEFSDDPNDFLPTITQHEESEDEFLHYVKVQYSRFKIHSFVLFLNLRNRRHSLVMTRFTVSSFHALKSPATICFLASLTRSR